jgi:3-deoxy-7-phosphoheptulonate synthase
MGGLAAGADGLMVEVHPRPYEAFSDGNQSLNYDQMNELLNAWNVIRESVLTFRKKKFEEIEKNVSNYAG